VIVITDALAGSGSLSTAKMTKSGSAGSTLQKRQQAASSVAAPRLSRDCYGKIREVTGRTISGVDRRLRHDVGGGNGDTRIEMSSWGILLLTGLCSPHSQFT
jgi:hypothetical protein